MTRRYAKFIAICSCHTHIQNTIGWSKIFNKHITDNNNLVHQWVFVADVVITKPLEDR